MVIVGLDLMWSGSLFQSMGAMAEKARWPLALKFVGGIARSIREEDLSALGAGAGVMRSEI